MQINVTKLHRELVEAGIPLEGVAATEPPRIDFLAATTEEQRALAEEILAVHVPENDQDKRQQAYLEAGVTVEAMVAALWERVVEERSDTSEALQMVRVAVQQQFPNLSDEQFLEK